MPATDSPAVLCARFLKANNYHETLQAFLAEAGLCDAESIKPSDLTIEKLLEEKKLFDLNVVVIRFHDGLPLTDTEAPLYPLEIGFLPSSANILHVSVEDFEEGTDAQTRQILFVSTADRRLHLLATGQDFALLESLNNIHDSPILSCTALVRQGLTTITTSMSGQVVLYDHQANRAIDERRDHKKYVVKVAQCLHEDILWVATAAWDAMIFLYQVQDAVPNGACSFGEPVASLSLATNPEALTFITVPESKQPLLLLTRKDSTSLHYYCWEETNNSTLSATQLRLLGSQNLAPHSSAWISFSPSALAICPTDSTLLAVATSSVPHMKVIIVRLLIPPLSPSHSETAVSDVQFTQASQARRRLAIEDQEDAAIKLHVSSFAPQTPYSTPQVYWRPDGSGVWVNGDDGVLRGLDATSGKVKLTLKSGHEPGSKIRSLWAGMIDVGGTMQECVVSGGFDKKLIIWKPSNGGDQVA